MIAVMLSRAIWLNIHLHILHEMDLSPSNELIETGLPTFFEDDSREYISMNLMGQFLSKIERKSSIGDIALSASERATHRQLTFEYSRRAALLPTLNDRLLLFFRCLPIEWNCAQSWMAGTGESARVYSRYSGAVPMESLRYFEWLQHAIVRSIIREFAGPGWNPETIAFRSNVTANDETSRYFPNTRILADQDDTYMEFPSEILTLKLARSQRGRSARGSDISRSRIPVGPARDFIGALKLALRAYLPDYYPGLDVAAAIAGVGARTLQRRLAQFGLTYSKLIEQTRLESAIDLLHDPHRKIIDIAYKVGYGDPAHFARAFRRAVGASPKAFRHSLMRNTFYDGCRDLYGRCGGMAARSPRPPASKYRHAGPAVYDVGVPHSAVAQSHDSSKPADAPTRKANRSSAKQQFTM